MRLLNDMLQLDRMASEEFELEIMSVDVAATIRDAIVSQEAAAAAKQITLQFVGDTAACIGDEHRIMQVLINLLSNAIKYAPENSSVIVQLAQRDEELLVSVQDSGPGIPEEKIPKIFDKFATVSALDIKKRGGTGLGLAICRTIVTQHGGQMGVTSSLGEGARFWFTLPLSGPLGQRAKSVS
jgi:signal transduction histidine kinase